MDPNTCLTEIRKLTARLLNNDHDGNEHLIANDGYTLAKKIEALDEWLSKDGFSPWKA